MTLCQRNALSGIGVAPVVHVVDVAEYIISGFGVLLHHEDVLAVGAYTNLVAARLDVECIRAACIGAVILVLAGSIEVGAVRLIFRVVVFITEIVCGRGSEVCLIATVGEGEGGVIVPLPLSAANKLHSLL